MRGFFLLADERAIVLLPTLLLSNLLKALCLVRAQISNLDSTTYH